MSVAADVLVIGFGNTLCGDDGIGPAVAREIAALGLSGVRVLAVHQLTPELAAEIAESRHVVFVDAAVTGEGITVSRVAGEPSAPSLTHATDQRSLLALAGALRRCAPDAWLVTVRGHDFGYRDGLSERGHELARRAVRRVLELIHPTSEQG